MLGLYGSWTLPKRTSGSDMIMSMLLVDPSWPNPDHGYGRSQPDEQWCTLRGLADGDGCVRNCGSVA